MKKVEHLIKEVYPGSIAEELEIEPGDVLLSINDQSIEDVFDYRYMIKDEYIEVLIRKPDGEEWVLEIDKDYDDDLGIEFENQLMSDYKSCSNKCIFCFIDQMPPNMRETLYFKDDDSRRDAQTPRALSDLPLSPVHRSAAPRTSLYIGRPKSAHAE